MLPSEGAANCSQSFFSNMNPEVTKLCINNVNCLALKTTTKSNSNQWQRHSPWVTTAAAAATATADNTNPHYCLNTEKG